MLAPIPRPARVATFDAGGLLGNPSVRAVQRMDEELRPLLDAMGVKSIIDLADVIGGISIGAVLVAWLGMGRPLDRLAELMRGEILQTFHRPPGHFIATGGGLWGPKYSDKHLKKLLHKHLGTVTLGELPRRVVIGSFFLGNDAEPMREQIFHNLPGEGSNGHELLADCVSESVRAPGYWRPHIRRPVEHNGKMVSGGAAIDGGVWAVNPAFMTASLLRDPRYVDRPYGSDEIKLLSIGTIRGNQRLRSVTRYRFWGFPVWGFKLPRIFLYGTKGAPWYYSERWIDVRERVEAVHLPRTSIKMDDKKKVPAMIAAADRIDYAPHLDWLMEHWLEDAK